AYAQQYTDMPMLVLLKQDGDSFHPDHFLRASHLHDNLGQQNNPEWKTLLIDESTGEIVVPNGSIGLRWGEKDAGPDSRPGRWNLEIRDAGSGRDIIPQLRSEERRVGQETHARTS